MIWQLIWKEWREHRWRIGVLTLVMVLAMWASRGRPDWTAGLFFLACMLLPVWVGAWTISSEKSSRTLATLSALPARRWMVFAIKSGWGLATMWIPLAAGLVMTMAYSSPMDVSPVPDSLIVASIWVGCPTSLYLTILALAMGARKEASAAMLGLIVMIGVLLWSICALVSAYSARSDWWVFISLTNPLSPWLVWMTPNREGAILLIVFYLAGMVGMWLLAAMRFCRVTDGPKPKRKPELLETGYAIEETGFPLGALAWREWREQRWIIAGAGLCGVGVAMVLSLGVVSLSRASVGFSELIYFFSLELVYMALAVPSVAGIILGVSSLAADMEPRLTSFWRSRPVRLGAFFWVKYLVAMSGIGLLVAVLLGGAMAGDQFRLGSGSLIGSARIITSRNTSRKSCSGRRGGYPWF